jgi:uncharacterized protein (TIGR02145 family)
MKTIFITAFLLFIHTFVFAQAPQGIPYQAVMRNADGSVMANSAVDLTFMIHDATATGTVVYQESHALTSNAQGLVSCVVGSGVVSQGNFANINWGGGAKFLQVMMGSIDLGTQQMLSVPYALYSNGVGVRVSETGDTLTIGGNSVIVPGISAVNPPALYTIGSGVTDIDGNFYPSIIINGQEWMQQNLAVTKYRNGDPIPTGLSDATWSSTTSGAYAIYDNDAANNTTYGKLYNWYTTADARGLCPAGWHVPTDCEWMYLESSLGMSVADQETEGWRGTNEGGALKATTIWTSPNTGATNSSGFTALPGGYRAIDGASASIGENSDLWSSTENGANVGLYRVLGYDYSIVYRVNYSKQVGFSVRCVKDTEASPIQGCTDGSACNFLANTTQDDGSCLYLNATCNDGNANTTNDVINANCQCSGILMVNGCTNAQACNYNPAANVDNGSCLYLNATCNDGNATTTNDVINANCQCAGTATGNGVFVPGNGLTDIDGTVYTSIVINGQEWMQQNLAVTKYRNGDPIPTGLSDATWQGTTSGAYAIYDNDAANNTIYGKLYNWYAVNDSRGLCPTGWHVPSDAEWSTFINYLDPNAAGGDVFPNIAGGKMKSTGTIENGDGLWYSPNEQATNESGFTGLPGGYRNSNGAVNGIGNFGYWWSSTETNSNDAWYRRLYYSNSNVYRTFTNKHFGFSVRCVRD